MKRLIFFISAIILLQGSMIGISAQTADRKKLPELPPPAKLNLPPIQQIELSNGMKVVLMEKHEVPLIQLNVVIKAGTANDPDGKTGLASMVMAMLMEGAGGLSSLNLADSIDFLGAAINTGADYHTSIVSLNTPASKFDNALVYLTDIIVNPDFPVVELDRMKKERLTRIMQWHDEPTAIASNAFNELLFGKQHVYGRPSIGSEKSINNISINDLKEFHNTYFNAENSFIAAVGDISKDELQTKLEQKFGTWKKGDAVDEKTDNAQQVNKRTVYLIDKPGAAQSVIYMGRIGVPRKTEDYYAIDIMNTILGGSFSSRLNQNLREDKGYTYGAGSYFGFRKAAGPFAATSSVQSEVTDKALIEFMKELNAIGKTITSDEITRAKNYIALGYPQDFQTVSSIAGKIKELLEYELPSDYFNNYITNILEVSEDEIRNAAQKYIDPDKLLIVVVGDRMKIEKGIKELNYGEVINMTIEDVLGKVPEIK
jgi:zinc protease